MTVSGAQRDPELVRSGLERWLRVNHPDRYELAVGPLGKPASGYSSETLLLDVAWRAGGADHAERLVARLPPAGGGIFPTYDLTRQAHVQEALSTTGVPVAPPLAVELDEEWIGAPFFLMERVEGNVLAEGYVATGALLDADADTQRSVQRDFLHTLADVHRVDWDALGLGDLTPAEERGLQHDVRRAVEYVQWAADGDVPSVVAEGLAWCRDHCPDPEPPLSLVWGDPRLGNIVYGDEWQQVALLDWEMASIGAAEMDLAWFVGLHDVGVASVGADLPGFEPHDAMLATYAARLGRDVEAYRWFEVFSLIRADSIYLRIRRMLLAAGMDEPWLRGSTPGQDRLAVLIA